MRTSFLLLGLALLPAACETVTVVTVEVASIDVTPAEITLIEGEERTLQATPRATDGAALSGRNVEWTSSEPAVATVDGGRVRAVSAGEADIRAELEGRRATATVTVLEGPRVAVSTAEVLLSAAQGANSQAVDVGVTNAGAGSLTGLALEVTYVGDESGWLQTSLNGTTAPTSLTLSASADALKPGSYEAVVLVTSPSGAGSAAAIEVTVEVSLQAPEIEVDADVVALVALINAQQPVTQSVGVTNGGGGTLTDLTVSIAYAPQQPGGWLDASLASPTAPTTLQLSASPTGLAIGIYRATVIIASPVATGGPREVDVVFTVATPASVSGSGSRGLR